jgi:hypothetical protein
VFGSFETNAGPPLVLFVTLAATTIGDAFATRRGVDLKVRLWVLAAATIVAARVGYVWEFRLAYFAAKGR